MIAVYADRRGGILAASSLGIDRMTGDRFVPLSSAHPILDPHFIGFGETQSGDLYAFSAPRGISRIEGNRLVDIGPDLDLLNMAGFRGQELWFSGRHGIFRVPTTSAGFSSEDRSDPYDYTMFGRADGLNSTQCSVGSPNMTIDSEGRLWIATVQGLAMIDLLRLPHQRRRPAIYIEEATVDRRMQPLPRQVILPPGNHHLELKFDAIELTSPEKIRFQYRLDGVDGAWLDAGRARMAIYTSVPIGTHWFHVRACSSDGIWDRKGIAYAIIQQPFFYETKWFRLIAVAVLVVLAVGVYRLRVGRIAAGMKARFDERLAERTRIARELHDTLLQTIQGSKLVADEALEQSDNPTRMRRALLQLSGWLGQATQEERAALNSLRSSTMERNDLAEAFRRALEDCRRQGSIDTSFSVAGEGKEMHPVVRDEVYRIGYEAIRNACMHAHASRMDVELISSRDVTLRVADNGIGIDPAIADRGKEGHYGLQGMRERAGRIAAKLTIASSSGSGTEITVVVPGRIIFRKPPDSLFKRIAAIVRGKDQV
jgi:signal transduction histidine kinase